MHHFLRSLAKGTNRGIGRPAMRPNRPLVEALEDRCVPSTATVDLTTAGSSGSINGAIFQQSNPQPTGCGVISDFLRIQAHSGSVEQGYNSDARPVQFDEKTSQTFTHSIHLNDIPIVLVNGVAYREFLLGINQSNSAPLLSLDKLELFLGSAGNLSGYDAGTGTLAGLTAMYDMNAGGGSNWVALNASLTHGNGSGDMYLLVPDRLFVTTAANPNPFVYVYSEFGVNYGANGGFEQWALPAQTGISQFGNLSGVVSTTGNTPLAGVSVTVSGYNDQGVFISLTVQTDTNGAYSFSGLRPGTYTITQEIPQGYTASSEIVGSLGGQTNISPGQTSVSTDSFVNVVLQANQTGLDYNFVDSLVPPPPPPPSSTPPPPPPS